MNKIYRGKKRYGKGWAYGVPMVLDMNGYKVTAIVRGAAKSTDGFVLDYDEVIPETVEVATGLTDKSGVEIFEGDIVSYEDISGVEDGVGNVLFDLFYGAWFVFVNDYEENSLADVAYNCEIIGNIHDNTELLT